MMHIVFMIVGAIVVLYLLSVVVFYFCQPFLVYYPRKTIQETPALLGLQFEDVRFATQDGLSIAAWFIPAKDSKGTVLFSHGNAANISHRLDTIYIINNLGYDLLIYDYRGYGNSEGGHPTEQGTYNDVQAAWDYLVKERHVLPEKIVVWGRSLGSAISAWLAQEVQPQALILESGFTSTADVGAGIYPFLPVRLLCRFNYATQAYVTRSSCPVLIIHSLNDTLIPYEHGRRLFEYAPGPKEFLQISGGHNDGFLVSGTTYSNGINDFLEKYRSP